MSNDEPPASSMPEPHEQPTSATPPPPPPPPPSANYGSYSPPVGAYGSPGQGGAGAGQPGTLLDRFVARLIDLIIVGIVAGVITAVLSAISGSYIVAGFLSAVVDAALFLGYFGYLESSRGQTIGKQIMKLKTFGPDGRSLPTMEQAIKRNLWTGLSILNIIPILGAIVAFVLYIVSVVLCAVNINGNLPDRRTWFDNFAGGTQVMKVG